MPLFGEPFGEFDLGGTQAFALVDEVGMLLPGQTTENLESDVFGALQHSMLRQLVSADGVKTGPFDALEVLAEAAGPSSGKGSVGDHSGLEALFTTAEEFSVDLPA